MVNRRKTAKTGQAGGRGKEAWRECVENRELRLRLGGTKSISLETLRYALWRINQRASNRAPRRVFHKGSFASIGPGTAPG